MWYNEVSSGISPRRGGFRLIGLVATGSTPVACAGLVALLLVVKAVMSKQSVITVRKMEGKTMSKARQLKLVAVSTLETMWAIGTSYVGGTLPA